MLFSLVTTVEWFFFVMSLCLTKGNSCCNNAFFLSVHFGNCVAQYHASVLRFLVEGEELNEALEKVSHCLTAGK